MKDLVNTPENKHLVEFIYYLSFNGLDSDIFILTYSLPEIKEKLTSYENTLENRRVNFKSHPLISISTYSNDDIYDKLKKFYENIKSKL